MCGVGGGEGGEEVVVLALFYPERVAPGAAIERVDCNLPLQGGNRGARSRVYLMRGY